MIALIANNSALAGNRFDGAPEIVALPVGIGNVVAERPAPRLACVNTRRDGHRLGRGDNQTIGAAKGAVGKARIVRDIVHRGEDSGAHPLFDHDLTQARDTRLIFGDRKLQGRFFTIVKTIHIRT